MGKAVLCGLRPSQLGPSKKQEGDEWTRCEGVGFSPYEISASSSMGESSRQKGRPANFNRIGGEGDGSKGR